MIVEKHPKQEEQNLSVNDKMSPIVRRISDRLDLNLVGLKGTGIEGQITLNDLMPLISQKKESEKTVMEQESFSTKKIRPLGKNSIKIQNQSDQNGYILEPLNHIRRITGEKLSASKQDIPHFYLSVDCQIDSLLNFKREQQKSEGCSFSINDLIFYAVARTLKKHPNVNSSWSDEGIKIYHNVNLAVAVASNRGLLTPVIRNAESKGILTIASEMKKLKDKVTNDQLDREDLLGGTFTVSNLGMYGIQQAIAVINPPQACVLAIGTAERKLFSRDDEIQHASIMNCTLSSDHRVLDGAEASQFLACLKLFLEDPLQMLV